MTSPPSAPLYVIGMHRSGTSAVAGLLAGLGIRPARWCAESRSNNVNPRGFFEPRLLVWENERLLNWLDASWSVPPGRVHDLDHAQMFLSEGARSARVLRRSQRREGAWFWKDPRLSLLMGYWDRVGTHALGVPASANGVVFVVRNPAAVASSLERRDSMGRRHAADLWRLYNASAAALSCGRPVHVIDYDRLLERPESQRSSLVDWLRSIGVRAHERRSDAGIDRTLRRSSSQDGSMVEEMEMYEQLLELHGSHAVFPDLRFDVDREAMLRLQAHRDARRHSWERANRVDRRLRRSWRRSFAIMPSGIREIASERRSARRFG